MPRLPLLLATLTLFCALAWVAGRDALLRRGFDARARALASAVESTSRRLPRAQAGSADLQALAGAAAFDQVKFFRGVELVAEFGQKRGGWWGPALVSEQSFQWNGPKGGASARLWASQSTARWWLHGAWLAVFGLLALALNAALRSSQQRREEQAWRLRDEESGHAAAAQALRRRLDLEQRLRGLLDQLRQCPAGEADSTLVAALGQLGRGAGVDRAFIFLFHEGGSRFGVTHHWAGPGVRESGLEGFQSLPTETFPWWMQQLAGPRLLDVPALEQLPPEASAERYLLGLHHTKSFLAAPLKAGGELLGFCGFSRLRQAAPFSPDDRETLATVAGGFSALISRARGELRAGRLLRMERLLAATARRFVEDSMEPLEPALSAALGDLGVFCGAGRVSLALAQGDGLRLQILQEWTETGAPRTPENQRSLAAAGLPSLLAALKSDGSWRCPQVERLGLEAEAERVEFERRGARGVLAVALRYGGHLQGFLLLERLALGELEEEAASTSVAVADILASALRRQRAETALRASDQRARALLTGVPDALLRLNRQGRILDARLPKGDRFFTGELLGQTLEALPAHVPGLAVSIVPALQAALAGSLRTGQPHALDLRLGEEGSQAQFLEARMVPLAEDEALLLLRDRSLERRRDLEHDRQLGNLLAIFDAGSRGLLLVDKDGKVQAFNKRFAEGTRADLGRGPQAGQHWTEVVHLQTHERFAAQLGQALEGQEPQFEGDLPTAHDGPRRRRLQFLPVFSGDGSVRAVCVSVEYLDRLQLVEEALEESEERYVLAARGANDGLWDLDLKRGKLYTSPRWEAQAGLEEGAGPRSLAAWIERVHPEDRETLGQRLAAHLEGRTDHFEAEYRLRHQERGEHRWMLSRGLAVRDAQGVAVRAAGSQTDIHLSKAKESSLLKDALQDPLTGLPNRALVVDRLGRCLARARRRKGYSFALLSLDTDNFKAVNQGMGHAAGDRLLKELARRLEGALRPGDTVGRLGGDEFAVLLDDLASPKDAELVSDRIVADCQKPFTVMGKEVYATVSVGLTISQPELPSAEEMLRDAETAMVQAKAAGRSRWMRFEPGMHAAAVSRLDLEGGLRQALAEGRFLLYYQPIVDLKDGRLLGFEALARWMHPERGLILPGEFIPLAEETGLILPLGRLVLKRALQTLADWSGDEAGRRLKMSVNLSPRQLEDPELSGALDQALALSGVQPSRLQLEVTESVLMNSRQGATRALEALRSRGLGIAIDDFGTGYSSLSYLHQFPADTLKIDRAFVSRIDGSAANEAVTGAIVTLGLNLGLALVAEGIETEMQARRLRELGCQAGQGYWFAKPLPEAEARALIGTKFKLPPR
jgi:diguanylate cyclase (GGDEF)-like protein/PAS domain S-box-containing protein